MNARILFKLSGAAALAGGLLRIASALPLGLDQVTLEGLWTAIDIMLSLGLIGIYLVRAEKLGLLGLAGFTLAMAALSFIGGPDRDVFGFSTYEQGAAALAISLAGFSLAWLRAGERPWAAPLCWFATLIAAGIPDYGAMAAGVLFGAGFVAAGWDLLRRR
jgi:hypothetical protein